MKRIRNGLGSICPVGEKVLEIARMGNFWRIRNLLDVGYGGFHNKGFRRVKNRIRELYRIDEGIRVSWDKGSRG